MIQPRTPGRRRGSIVPNDQLAVTTEERSLQSSLSSTIDGDRNVSKIGISVPGRGERNLAVDVVEQEILRSSAVANGGGGHRSWNDKAGGAIGVEVTNLETSRPAKASAGERSSGA